MAAQEESLREGLPLARLDFDGLDNAPCRQLVEHKDNGLFAQLEDECQVPKGSDAGLHGKVHQHFKDHPSFARPPPSAPRLAFSLRHYAAEVTYDVSGFLEKNKDRCPEDLLVLLRTSRVGLLRVAFVHRPSRRPCRAKGALLWRGLNLPATRRAQRSLRLPNALHPMH